MASSAFLASIAHPTEIAALLRWKFSGRAHATQSLSAPTSQASSQRSSTSTSRSASPEVKNGESTSSSESSTKSSPRSDLNQIPTANGALQDPANVTPVKTSSWERCEYYLFLTSRSFAMVISELNDNLRKPVALFYLVLRGLDTIEDDMTLDRTLKLDLLRNFYTFLSDTSWTFDGVNEAEKDRALLVDFTCVTEEMATLEPHYVEVITDITKRMGEGMASYLFQEESLDDLSDRVKTVRDYNLYCYYVAGLVGEGLTRLFLHSDLEPDLIDDPPYALSVHMGLFLQKTNIIRDFLEDTESFRVFWPKEIWSKYVPSGKVEDLIVIKGDKARKCLNEMVADALGLIPDVLDYLSMLREKSVFRFCAIPQVRY